MKILKKILAFAIILGLFGQINLNAFADSSELKPYYINDNIEKYKNLIISEMKGGKKIILKIDIFLNKINSKQAKKLEEKIYSYIRKLDKKAETTQLSNKELQIFYILDYIKFKLKEKFQKDEKVEEKKLNISEEDNKKVNAELIKIQNNLLNQGIRSFENILTKLEDYSNFEEKGNFKLKLNVDHKNFGKGKIELILKDYISKNSGFDTQFKSKIEAIIESTPKGKEEVKMKISAFIDYILKDQNYYVLLKNLNITDSESNEEIKTFIEKAKQLAKKNKYIKIEDKQSTEIFKKLKQLSPANILKQGKNIASKPLFKAYKKDGNKFYLIPSKYACDTAKKLSETFDPFNGNKCTESQYKDLLKKVSDAKIEFYIDFSGKNTKIGFEADSVKKDIEKFRGDISFSKNYIEEINIIVTPIQDKFPGEGAKLNYKRNNFLNANFYAKQGKNTLQLKSNLDKNNNFTSIDFNIKSNSSNAELKLNNKKISGKYNIEGYNNKTVGIISGKTDYNNKLDEIKISNQIISSSEYNPYENLTIFEYSKKLFNLENKFSSKGTQANFKIKGNYSSNALTSGNIDFIIKTKKAEFNYETYKTTYSGDFKEILNTNITLKNRNITGSTKFYLEDKEYTTITHKGKIEKNLFELNNKINLSDKATKQFMKGFDPMGNDSKVKKVNMNINLKVDTRGNNNNGNIYIDVNLDTNKVIEFELDNKSTKIYKKVNIQAPSKDNTIPLEEAMENETLY